MDEKRYNFIDKTFVTFDFGMIQDFFTLFSLMDKNDISREELTKYRDLKASAISSNKPVGRLCPECEAPMALEYVNISPRTVTGDDSKIVYTCINRDCMHQIFE